MSVSVVLVVLVSAGAAQVGLPGFTIKRNRTTPAIVLFIVEFVEDRSRFFGQYQAIECCTAKVPFIQLL